MKKKYLLMMIILLIIPVAAFYDKILFGYKGYLAYMLTCLFEAMIFFAGISVGENITKGD